MPSIAVFGNVEFHYDILAKRLPAVSISLSSEVCAEVRQRVIDECLVAYLLDDKPMAVRDNPSPAPMRMISSMDVWAAAIRVPSKRKRSSWTPSPRR